MMEMVITFKEMYTLKKYPPQSIEKISIPWFNENTTIDAMVKMFDSIRVSHRIDAMKNRGTKLRNYQAESCYIKYDNRFVSIRCEGKDYHVNETINGEESRYIVDSKWFSVKKKEIA